jgi:lysophospholipase L1-like esterase
MKIKEKINMNYDGLVKNGPITIVAFGDSVTHGALASEEYNYETVYWNRLRNKILEKRNYVPVNVINAGIGGISAERSLERMDSQVLAHNPDLVIVCFGLNDVNGELHRYLNSLTTIFNKCKERDIDIIFMTPNMLNTYVHEQTAKSNIDYAKKTAQMQNEGKMDLFMENAVALAKNMGVTVCDCYKEWKKISETQDTTLLLANYINHPTKEMHELFAEKLFRIIFTD